MTQEELYHTISTVINNTSKRNWRIVKEVEQLIKTHHLSRMDLIHDTWLEYQDYPHEHQPCETDIQSTSRFVYNFLRRKKLHLSKTQPELYIEDIMSQYEEPQVELHNPDLAPAEMRSDFILDALRERLSVADMEVLLEERVMRPVATSRGMGQREYKKFIRNIIEQVKQEAVLV